MTAFKPTSRTIYKVTVRATIEMPIIAPDDPELDQGIIEEEGEKALRAALTKPLGDEGMTLLDAEAVRAENTYRDPGDPRY